MAVKWTHVPPNSGGTTGGQTAQQASNAISAALATHTARTTAHHAPPDISGLATQASVDEKASQSDVDDLSDRVDDVARDSLIEPNYWLSTNAARTFVVHIHPMSNPDTATQIRLNLGGTQVTQRLVSGETDYSFDVGASGATNINSNLRGATTIRVNVEFLNARNQILTTEGKLLRVLSVPPTQGLNQDQVDQRIAPYARRSPSGTIADAQIPQSIARDNEIPSNSDIDGRVPTWARANSPSGTIPDSRIPSSIARDSELGPQITVHTTQTSYDAASASDGRIHVLAIP